MDHMVLDISCKEPRATQWAMASRRMFCYMVRTEPPYDALGRSQADTFHTENKGLLNESHRDLPVPVVSNHTYQTSYHSMMVCVSQRGKGGSALLKLKDYS